MSTLVFLAALVGGAWLAWTCRRRGLAAGLGAVAVLPAVTLAQQLTVVMLLPVAALAVLVGWFRWGRTSAVVARWGNRRRRKAGVASTLDLARFGSARAVRAKTAAVRPSLAGLSRKERRRLPTGEVGVLLCQVGPQRLWSSIEDVVLVFGGPRRGKTGWLAGRILDAPGAVLATSTRTDLYEATAGMRREQRGPVYVFNPVGLGDLESTITFDPLTGCADPVTTSQRAGDMVAAGAFGAATGDRQHWQDQAARVLAALLHAAALGGCSMRDVLNWVAEPEASRRRVTSLLRTSPEPSFVAEWTQFVTTNDRTRTSITTTIMPALGWLTHPAAANAATGECPFDVEQLLDSKATVYLLGAEEARTAPLVCALTGHVAREARRIAALKPKGRLDPPMTLALDEAALVSPVPLDRWSADMGGRGVLIIAAFQSRAQLLDRFGEAKAAVILNNSGGKMLFGGTCDPNDLGFWSNLIGDRDEPVITTDKHGQMASRTVRSVPVLTPAQLSSLPDMKVVAFRRGMLPTIGTAPMAWNRPDVRAYQRAQAGQHTTSEQLRATFGELAARVADLRAKRARRAVTPHTYLPEHVPAVRPDGLPAVVPATEWSTEPAPVPGGNGHSSGNGQGSGPGNGQGRPEGQGRWN